MSAGPVWQAIQQFPAAPFTGTLGGGVAFLALSNRTCTCVNGFGTDYECTAFKFSLPFQVAAEDCHNTVLHNMGMSVPYIDPALGAVVVFIAILAVMLWVRMSQESS